MTSKNNPTQTVEGMGITERVELVLALTIALRNFKDAITALPEAEKEYEDQAVKSSAATLGILLGLIERYSTEEVEEILKEGNYKLAVIGLDETGNISGVTTH